MAALRAKRRSRKGGVEGDGMRALALIVESEGRRRPVAPNERPLTASERSALKLQARLEGARFGLRTKAISVGGGAFPLV